MGTLRFGLLAVGLFALAFAGMSWGSKILPTSRNGAPAVVVATNAAPATPDAIAPAVEESARPQTSPTPTPSSTRNPDNAKPQQSESDKERDKLRLQLWQAAIGYKLSPCDPAMKKNLVQAVTNYVGAWGSMAGCKAGACAGDNTRVETATAAFKTAADIRVHDALRDAYERGGIAAADFPKIIGSDAFVFTGPPVAAPQIACVRQSENTRR